MSEPPVDLTQVTTALYSFIRVADVMKASGGDWELVGVRGSRGLGPGG